MLENFEYMRESAAEYAVKWALSRNPDYYNFDSLGGDCTNFVSQCLFAGCGVMNYTRTFGWYYIDLNNRAPAWTGVEYLYNFITSNLSEGPYAVETTNQNAKKADIVQLSDADGRFYHSLIIVEKTQTDFLVAAHSFNALYRPLSDYYFDRARFLHIQGFRKYV